MGYLLNQILNNYGRKRIGYKWLTYN